MTLSAILKAASWPDVEACIRRDYVLAEENEEHSRFGEGWELALREVYETLHGLRPEAADDIAIVIDLRAEHGTEFHDVGGIKPGSDEGFALDFVRWEEWLAMEIAPDTLQRYSAFEIAGHCLLEMTFYGLTRAEIAAVGAELLHRKKTAKFVPWEEVKRKLDQ